MKKIRLVICCLLMIFAFCSNGFSQNQQGSQYLSAGIGIPTSVKLGDYPELEFEFFIDKDPVVHYTLTVVNRIYFPTLHLSYSYALHKKIILGITGAYENSSGDFKQASEIVGNYRQQRLTVALESKYLYLNRPNYCLYGSLGLGGAAFFGKLNFPQASTLLHGKSFSVNTFISPIAIRVGKQLGGFCEVGFGYKGLINAGICYQF